jgi:hypothetical protein
MGVKAIAHAEPRSLVVLGILIVSLRFRRAANHLRDYVSAQPHPWSAGYKFIKRCG